MLEDFGDIVTPGSVPQLEFVPAINVFDAFEKKLVHCLSPAPSARKSCTVPSSQLANFELWPANSCLTHHIADSDRVAQCAPVIQGNKRIPIYRQVLGFHVSSAPSMSLFDLIQLTPPANRKTYILLLRMHQFRAIIGGSF